MELKLGNEVYKDGEQVDYHFLPSYTYGKYHGQKIGDINPKSVPSVDSGTLQYKKGEKTFFSTTPAGWILKNTNGRVYNFNTEVNILNTNPVDKNKLFNIKLVKKEQVQSRQAVQPQAVQPQAVQPQALQPTVRTFSTIDDDYFDHQKVEYLILKNSTLYPQLSGQNVDLTLTKDMFFTKNKGELMWNPFSIAAKVGWWIVEGGKMTHDLSQFNILNNSYFITNKPNIQFLPSGNMTERMKRVKAEKERKAAEAAQEDQAAETNVTPIPCSQTAINLKDRVKYGVNEGVVTGFEITYDNTELKTQTVRCDENLFSITAGIEKNKSDLFTKRNPGVVYAHVVAGSRKRRRKRKTRHGMKIR
jgi:hypothetical protein